ncbi:TPA: RHS repeat-associated core domain-containing protein [Pseudomonas putida]|nr:RHS repeat-associated core domain-containing protein [Pseudomonas putida]
MQKRSSSSLYFYQRDKLVNVWKMNAVHTLFKGPEALIAELSSTNAKAILLGTDIANSVLSAHEHERADNHLYTPYGYDHRATSDGLISGFNGQRRDQLREGYLLGNGYRNYNPHLLRFESPDNFSPFYEGGLNTYAYCLNDPVNLHDPSGHMFKKIRQTFGREASKINNKHSASAPSLQVDEQPGEYAQQPAYNPHPQTISPIPQFMDYASKTGGSAPIYAMSDSELKTISSNHSRIKSIAADTTYRRSELKKYSNALNRHIGPKIRKVYETTIIQHRANITHNTDAINALRSQNEKLEKPWLNDAVSNLRNKFMTTN